MSPSFQLLITTLRAGLHMKSNQGLSSVIRQATDEHWQQFLNLCECHNVSNLAHSSFLKNEAWDSLPGFVQQILDDRYHNTVAWSLKLGHTLEQIIPIFEKADIPLIPWKGPMLSQRLFDTIWDREYADLDFLIPPQHQSAADKLLNKLNYHLDQNDLIENPPSLANNNDHCRSYQHASSGVLLEIHTKPFPGAFHFPRTVDGMLTECSSTRFHSLPIRQLSLEDEFLLLLAHGAKHHWCQLNWLCDFAFFTRRYRDILDWEKITLRSSQLGCSRILKIALALCADLLGSPPPSSLLSRPATDPIACRLATVFFTQMQSSATPAPPQNRLRWKYRWFKYSLLSRERYRDRLPLILSAFAYLITPNSADRKLFPPSLPLCLCAWLARPFRLIFKYTLRH